MKHNEFELGGGRTKCLWAKFGFADVCGFFINNKQSKSQRTNERTNEQTANTELRERVNRNNRNSINVYRIVSRNSFSPSRTFYRRLHMFHFQHQIQNATQWKLDYFNNVNQANDYLHDN